MIDLKLKYKTEGGLETLGLIHCPENKDHSRIMGFVRLKDGSVRFYDWYENGRNMMIGEGNALDLVLAPVEITRWFNVYRCQILGVKLSTGYSCRADALSYAEPNVLETISLTFTVPQK